MRELKTARELNHFVYSYERLSKIARTLHKLDEGDCNGRSERGQKRADTRSANLEREAQGIAADFGLKAYHQGDPRGCSLYLIEKGQRDSYASEGIAILW